MFSFVVTCNYLNGSLSVKLCFSYRASLKLEMMEQKQRLLEEKQRLQAEKQRSLEEKHRKAAEALAKKSAGNTLLRLTSPSTKFCVFACALFTV